MVIPPTTGRNGDGNPSVIRVNCRSARQRGSALLIVWQVIQQYTITRNRNRFSALPQETEQPVRSPATAGRDHTEGSPCHTGASAQGRTLLHGLRTAWHDV